jgi:peroxiredoxin
MKRINLFLSVAVACAWIGFAQAADDEKPLKIGDPAPAWVDLPGIDGKKHSLKDLKDKDVVVVVFTCNSCSVAVAYEDRIAAFHKKYCGPDRKVALVAINVNLIPEDALPRMQERAKSKNFAFPYLFDETQNIARDFAAVVTPEFFVFGKDRKLVYHGAMDNTSVEKNVKINYLEPAVESALKGEKPVVEEMAAKGCKIRYVRKKD